MIDKPVGKFTEGLNAVSDARMRMFLAGSLLMAVFFGVHFARLFFPGGVETGDGQQDYAAFYGAARFVTDGGAGNLYDPAIFQKAIGAETTLLWLYPPPMLIVLAPLGLFSYGAAKIIMALATIACAFAIGRVASGENFWGAITIISPAAFATLFVGQLSAFFGLLLVGGMLLAERRPLLAGACFALLTIKPQYGLLVIPFLIAVRAWRTFAAAAVFSSLLIIVSIAVFGAEMWGDFLQSLLSGVHAAYYQSGGHPGRITASDAIKAAGVAAPPAWALYVPLIIAAIAGIFIIAKGAPRFFLVAYTLAASALVCPYLFAYDFFLYSAAVLILATHINTLKPVETYALAALWFAPFAPFIGGSTVTPAIVWPVTAMGVFVIYRIAMRSAGATAST